MSSICCGDTSTGGRWCHLISDTSVVGTNGGGGGRWGSESRAQVAAGRFCPRPERRFLPRSRARPSGAADAAADDASQNCARSFGGQLSLCLFPSRSMMNVGDSSSCMLRMDVPASSHASQLLVIMLRCRQRRSAISPFFDVVNAAVCRRAAAIFASRYFLLRRYFSRNLAASSRRWSICQRRDATGLAAFGGFSDQRGAAGFELVVLQDSRQHG